MSDKLRYDLIPARPLQLMAEAFTVGGKKHGEYDWQGLTPEVYEAKIFRHFQAIRQGEYVCPEDGISHFGAMMADTAIMCELIMAEQVQKQSTPIPDLGFGEAFGCPYCTTVSSTEKAGSEHINKAHPDKPATMG